MSEETVAVKMRIPLTLTEKRKLEKICKTHGKKQEEFVAFLIRDGIKSVEKFGAVQVD